MVGYKTNTSELRLWILRFRLTRLNGFLHVVLVDGYVYACYVLNFVVHVKMAVFMVGC